MPRRGKFGAGSCPWRCAFHTPLMEPARGPLARYAAEVLTEALVVPCILES